ncbi:hypothetical protein Tco_1391393 [Tanacetum coccineum]
MCICLSVLVPNHSLSYSNIDHQWSFDFPSLASLGHNDPGTLYTASGVSSRESEIDIFLASDDSTPPGFESDYDSEGDILLLEELLNDDLVPLAEYNHFTFDVEPDTSVKNDFNELNEDECFDPRGGTDISKITRKPSKTGKHGHKNGRVNKSLYSSDGERNGKVNYVKSRALIDHLNKECLVDDGKAQVKMVFTLDILIEQAQMSHQWIASLAIRVSLLVIQGPRITPPMIGKMIGYD